MLILKTFVAMPIAMFCLQKKGDRLKTCRP
jgi:hypothetical protein